MRWFLRITCARDRAWRRPKNRPKRVGSNKQPLTLAPKIRRPTRTRKRSGSRSPSVTKSSNRCTLLACFTRKQEEMLELLCTYDIIDTAGQTCPIAIRELSVENTLRPHAVRSARRWGGGRRHFMGGPPPTSLSAPAAGPCPRQRRTRWGRKIMVDAPR